MRSYEAKKGMKLKALIRNRIKIYRLVDYYNLRLVGLTKEDKLQDKMQINTMSIHLP